MLRETGHWSGERVVASIRAALVCHSSCPDSIDAGLRHAAVAIILRPGEGERLETLFIKRCEHPEDPWSGQMAFPGGRMDPEDESLDAVARRETLEEVGLALSPEMALGRLPVVKGGRLAGHGIAVHPFVYYCETPGEPTPNYEVADTVWVPMQFLGSPENVCDYFFPPDPFRRAWPSFQYGPYTIWGLTYRIVATFMTPFGIELPTERT